ncbi:MAG: phosphonopyruvate decarboxylase [candidate division NC10 bacterium]|nr:phosphonopyruvate decarboxylase [candidate division NC10 bacterium]
MEKGEKVGHDWHADVHQALHDARITVVAYVPDGGHRRLIELCRADPMMRAVPLACESEGPCLLAGAWLGGQRGVLLMQSSGLGNCINNFGLIKAGQFPFLTLITVRGSWGEANPWMLYMGRRTRPLLELADFHAYEVDAAVDAAPTVTAAAQMVFACSSGAGVMLTQRLFGAKRFDQ